MNHPPPQDVEDQATAGLYVHIGRSLAQVVAASRAGQGQVNAPRRCFLSSSHFASTRHTAKALNSPAYLLGQPGYTSPWESSTTGVC
jgi:hypothetical protein